MVPFTALILAAGYGSRISGVTTDPKSLLKIKDRTLMDWHFHAFKMAGIERVVVVTGYKSEILENYLQKFNQDFCLSYVRNDEFLVKGNTYSFYYGLEKVESRFLLFDADLIYDPQILKSFIEDQESNQVLVGASSIDDIECTKAMVDREGYVRLTVDKRAVTKAEQERLTFVGEAIGILKFSKKYRDDVFQECQQFLADESNHLKNWEHLLNRFLLTHEMSVHQTVSDSWIEIDTKEDFERAQEIFIDDF